MIFGGQMQQKKHHRNKSSLRNFPENLRMEEVKPFTLAECISKICIDDYSYGDTIKQLQEFEIAPESVIYKKKKL
jgi:hypothetical protein